MGAAEPGALERYLSDDGWLVEGAQVPMELDEAAVLALHRAMVRQRLLDERLLARERQGRVPFHAPSVGQEAAVFGAAWALEAGDWVFPALREAGVGLLMAQRAGEGEQALEAFVAQCLASALDPTLGRQLPSHFSWPRGRFVSVSTPIASQLPQAVGAAWAARLRGDAAAVMAFLGDGATSEGDFHTALDLAARERLPVVFFCQNNQWALSLPVARQTAAATIAAKARAYRMAATRVDGNDVFACFAAARDALGAARAGEGPTLVEALTYRVSPMTAADDPARYRDPAEAERWRAKDPVARLEAFCLSRGLLTADAVAAVRAALVVELDAVFSRVARAPRVAPTPANLFDHVYRVPAHQAPPWHLREQAEEAARVAAGSSVTPAPRRPEEQPAP